jgi:hypothetical protein
LLLLRAVLMSRWSPKEITQREYISSVCIRWTYCIFCWLNILVFLHVN